LALKVKQLEAKNVQLEEKIGKLEAKVELQDSLLTSLLREKNERTAAAADSVSFINNQLDVDINGLPSSCEDLKLIGHTLNGFYFVMGPAKMESVYCDFTKLPSDAGK
jgi:vacuolar-type H+-ATPase subunit I/STV1